MSVAAVSYAGDGLQVTEHMPGQGPRTFKHTIFLTGVHADSPARAKLTLWQVH